MDSRAEWASLLGTISRLYKYPFADQLMIHAQRPGATACASYEVWNDTMRRYVRRGAKGIALVDNSGDAPRLRYVFDIADTGTRRSSRPFSPWEINDGNLAEVQLGLRQAFNAEGDWLSSQLQDVARDLAEMYFDAHRHDIAGIVDGSLMAGYDEGELQFAMNDVYLRDTSRKVRAVLENKRRNGKYAACPPYGYKKARNTTDQLVPDENTAPVVQRIFALAAAGESTRSIAARLTREGVMPPLKYRAECRDEFTERGAARVSDAWNYTTVKRILRNRVYLGHTILGRSRKVSVKSKKKLPVPEEDWFVTENTHEALVSLERERAHVQPLAPEPVSQGRDDRCHNGLGQGVHDAHEGVVLRFVETGHYLRQAETIAEADA